MVVVRFAGKQVFHIINDDMADGFRICSSKMGMGSMKKVK